MSINEVPVIEKEIEPEKTQSSATPEVEAKNGIDNETITEPKEEIKAPKDELEETPKDE